MNKIAMTFQPGGLDREAAAAYLSLGVTTFERLVQAKEAPQPRKFPGARRVAWLRSELDAWLQSLPESTLLPPDNTGAPKPRKSKAQAIAEQVAPSVRTA